MGDFNHRTGRRAGVFDMCEYNQLKIANGIYKHKTLNKHIWTQTTNNLKSIADYVMIKQNTIQYNTQ